MRKSLVAGGARSMRRTVRDFFWMGSSSTPTPPGGDVIGVSNNGEAYPYYYSDDVALFQAILLAQNL